MKEWMTAHDVLGLVLFAPEGANGTVAGSSDGVASFKEFLFELLGTTEIRFKDSESDRPPFRRISVDLREEIVGLKRPDIHPDSTENFHLSPAEWHAALSDESPKLLIDTRNRYETRAGMFKGAIDPDINIFSEWGTYLDQADLPKDLPVYMYCTGGIRCEKALIEMKSRGFDEVYQLRDGILGYLEEYPDGLYEGECYVFDQRVAVDSHLRPTQIYGTCPGCGLTAKEQRVCERCGKTFTVCEDCSPAWGPGCSKDCRYVLKQRAKKSTLS